MKKVLAQTKEEARVGIQCLHSLMSKITLNEEFPHNYMDKINYHICQSISRTTPNLSLFKKYIYIYNCWIISHTESHILNKAPIITNTAGEDQVKPVLSRRESYTARQGKALLCRSSLSRAIFLYSLTAQNFQQMHGLISSHLPLYSRHSVHKIVSSAMQSERVHNLHS